MFFFIPTGSNAERSRTAAVTLTLAGLCVAVFVATSLDARPGLEEDLPDWVLEAQEKPGAESRAALDEYFFERLERLGGLERRLSLVPRRGLAQVGWLTNELVHFGWAHLLGNLLFLWLVGPLLEEAWGRWRFLAFYLGAGVVASAVQFLLVRHSPASIGGASGAIAGCMGAFAVRFATTRIRFLYFIWFLRIFVGSVQVPAWLCGAAWLGRELLDLGSHEQTGVATGAHVGGFLVGGLVALAMRGLGYEKELLTVAEGQTLVAERNARLSQAELSLRSGDLESARDLALAVVQEDPQNAEAAALLAELDVRTRRGVARLERQLRALASAGQWPDALALVSRLWPHLSPADFTEAMAWQLAEHLGPGEKSTALLEALAQKSGRLALKARERLEALSPEGPGAPDPLDGPALPLRGRSPLPARAPLPPAPAPGPASPRLLGVSLVAADRAGLLVSAGGTTRRVPFSAVRGVHGGLIGEPGRPALVVDIELSGAQGQRAALRLLGTDPLVPSLLPGQPPSVAWRHFIAGVRRAAGVQPDTPAWSEFPDLAAFTATWSGA